ncbi:MAG: hypothetical protein RR904_00195 [Bacilli bacterium]
MKSFNKNFIIVNLNKITKKHFEAMQRVYPNAFYLTNRNEINKIKTIKLVESNIIQNVDTLFLEKINFRSMTPTVEYIQKFCSINNNIIFLSSNIIIPDIEIKIIEICSKKLSDININSIEHFKQNLINIYIEKIIENNRATYFFDSTKSDHKYLDIPVMNFNYHNIKL